MARTTTSHAAEAHFERGLRAFFSAGQSRSCSFSRTWVKKITTIGLVTCASAQSIQVSASARARGALGYSGLSGACALHK